MDKQVTLWLRRRPMVVLGGYFESYITSVRLKIE